MKNLTTNTSYTVSVSIFNALLEYRLLPDTIMVRTLPSGTYRPLILPKQSIQLNHFTINENPKLLDVFILWIPADGMCIVYCQLFQIIPCINFPLDMVCQYGIVLYETDETPDNKHSFQLFKIIDVSHETKQKNDFFS